jgi:hypothetical protein
VSGKVLRVAWYRFTATFGRRRGGYLTIVLLIGLTGGIAMASVAAARRTQASFATFLASTNPSDMSVTVGAPELTRELARLPGVQHVGAAAYSVNAFPLGRNGAPVFSAYLYGAAGQIGSLNGEYFGQDRVAVTAGRMADPRRAGEFVATAHAARLLGWRVGQVIRTGVYTNAQTAEPAFGTAKVRPYRILDMKLTGIVVFNDEVVLDQVDGPPSWVLFTPAFTRPFGAGLIYGRYSLKLRNGASAVPAVEREIIGVLPKGSTYSFHVTSVVEGQADRTVRPVAIALGVFGVIAMLAALLIALQVIARQLQARDEDVGVLRALGASPAMTTGDGLFGILAAVALGSLLAAGVAIGLSPLAPIGPLRPVYPSPGIAADFAVLGSGLLVLIGGIGSAAVVLARRQVPARLGRQERARASRGSGLARLAAGSGVPVSVVAGVRFALEPGHGRTAVPVRSALTGAVLAVLIVVASLTFGSGLSTLVSHPALYGWNWNYALASPNADVPPQALALLSRDRTVAAWSAVNFANVQIDGQTVPVLVARTHAKVAPPMLSGHPLEADNQIVLGAATLAQLHKRVGDTVVASYGKPADAPVYVPPTRLTIVGTATLPAVGITQTLHPSMGTGAILSPGVVPAAFHRFLTSRYRTLNGPKIAFVRLRAGVPPAQGLASLRRVARAGTRALFALPNQVGGGGASVEVLPVQYPAEIENYRSIGATPVLLAAGLAAGAVAALGLTLAASVRRRRRDLALLKALGFTQRQLAACVAWQSTVAAAAGLIAGIPLGIALGRWLWILFARDIYAVPLATVPAPLVIYVGLGALVLANAVALLPGAYAARTPAALVLRAE